MRPELIVLHYTAMASADAALRRLCDPAAEVSAHYLIGADGTVWHMVDEAARAWHAGAGEWQGRADVNSRSIGIELDNRGDHPFAEPQMAALETLLRAIMIRWSIAPEGVIGHSDMAPGRKRDPGPRFDWARLMRGGLARAAPTTPSPMPDLDAEVCFQRAGYTADAPQSARLQAFRDRYRPWARGALSPEDLSLLAALGH